MAYLHKTYILLQLQHEIITPPSKVDAAAIFALDLKITFDRVSHTTLLQNLESIAPGQRTYNYVKKLLTARTEMIQIGDIATENIPLPSIGTPQGAVFFPLLFNLALLNLFQQLARVPHLRHSIYADDITLWTSGGSDAQIEGIPQTEAEIAIAGAA